MKQMKKISVLAAGSIAIGLQLFSGMALAEEVCLEGDTVMGIKNMEVLTDQYGVVNIDVDFRYATGFEVYGSGLDNFPFTGGNAEEDLFAMMAAINNTLGANNPVPGSAGQPGQDVYFIGAEEESEGGAGLIAVVGSENLTGDFWDPCTQANDCIAGAAVKKADERFTYADLSKAAGGSCGNTPPDPTDPPTTSYPIAPCITGSWYLPARDGEGYNIEIIGNELDPQLLAYFYTYDEDGNQMWLVGSGPANGDTAVVPVQVTSGPVYGAGYDPADVLREDWGTLTFKFATKDTGSVERASTMGFGTDTVDIIRLTYVTGLTCP
jgi:hypothetical protein